MCKALLHEIEMEFRVRNNIDTPIIPEEFRLELRSWMQTYLNQMPEYQNLIEDYH